MGYDKEAIEVENRIPFSWYISLTCLPLQIKIYVPHKTLPVPLNHLLGKNLQKNNANAERLPPGQSNPIKEDTELAYIAVAGQLGSIQS